MSRLLKDGLLGKGGRNPRGEMPFLDHLEELRWRILWSILAVGVFSIVGFLLVHYFEVVGLLLEPGKDYLGPDWQPIFLSPTDPFFLLLKLALAVGLILSSPVIIYQAWAFLSPALEPHEKRAIVPALYMGLVLFAAGVAMAYYIALPISIRFLMGLLTDFMTPSIEATRYLGFVIKLLLGFGLVFELPVVILILSALGLVTPAFLRARRRHAIVIITVVASFLSPGDVVAVTVLMMIPLIFLYEFSILLSVLMWKRREARENTIHEQEAPGGSIATDEGTAAATTAAGTASTTPVPSGAAHGESPGGADAEEISTPHPVGESVEPEALGGDAPDGGAADEEE
ncbi:MAG: twin-arginine translocase subunit TatC [Gemmatimonadetes bacterium]|nr:twin-arginine translocase subunit TatC [Gemmatimonadota bacterium]